MKVSKTLLSFILLLVISIAWGSSYILMKKSLVALDPYQLASTRLFIACWCFVPIAIINFKKIDWSSLKYFLIVGFCGSGIPSFCFAIAQTKINSSLTGALSSLTPLFTLMLGLLFYKFQYSVIKIVGIFLGMLGAFMILASKTDIHGIIDPWFGLFVILATVLYAWSTNTIGKHLNHINSVDISAMAFSLMAIPATILFFTTGSYNLAMSGNFPFSAFYPVIALALLSSVITSIAYFYLINISGSLFASTVSYLTPVVAIIFGLYDGEKLFFVQIIGIIIMLSGIVVTKIDSNRLALKA